MRSSLFHRFRLLALALLASMPGFAQEGGKRPVLGLALSGGGIKGACHIGVLKVMEEEGLRPDLITGTSIGSLVGGLYACGYTADQIQVIMESVVWDEVLTNKIGLDKISIEEKPYYGRFLVELPFDKEVKLPSGLIQGQKISELFRYYTLPQHGTSDFSQLPIPFAAMATDVGRGEVVVQDKGFLADAMRASMSIPTFFSAVVQGDTLLVDGGELRNFPASDARERGADIVIGVDIGDGMLEAKKLSSALDILSQSSMFTSLTDIERQKGFCDLYIRPDYAPYTTTSFESEAVPYLVRKGYEAADTLRPLFREIAKRVGPRPPQPGVILPGTLRVDSVEVRGVGRKMAALVEPRFRIEGKQIAVKDLEERIDLLYGTRHFDLVQYRMEPRANDSVLVIEARPSAPGRIGLSLNYDRFHEVSVGMLFMAHDQLLQGSRFVLEGYLGRFPALDVNYLKYIGLQRRSAMELLGYYDSGPGFFRDEQGNEQGEMRVQNYGGSLRYRTTASRTTAYGVQASLRRNVYKPTVGAIIEVGEVEGQPILIDISTIENFRSARLEYALFFQFNDQDQVVYPERGWRVLASVEDIEGARSALRYTDEAIADLTPEEREEYESSKDDLSPYDRFDRIRLEWSGRSRLSERAVLMFEGAGMLSSRNDLILGDQVNVGGIRRPDRFGVAFWGLNEYDGYVSDLAMARVGLQWRFGKNIFLQAAANGLSTGFDPDDLTEVLGDRFVLGYGSTFGLRTKAGIAQVGWSSNASNWQNIFWLNFGFRI